EATLKEQSRARPEKEAPPRELDSGVVAIACTFCKGRLPRAESVYCASCLAPHHVDCWDSHTKCAACGVAARGRAEEVRQPRSRRAALRGAFLGAAVSAAVAALAFGVLNLQVRARPPVAPPPVVEAKPPAPVLKFSDETESRAL